MTKRSSKRILKRRSKKVVKKRVVNKKDIKHQEMLSNQSIREQTLNNNPQLSSNISARAMLLNRLSGSTMPGINIGTNNNSQQKTLGDLYAERTKLQNESQMTKTEIEQLKKDNKEKEKERNDVKQELAKVKAQNERLEKEAFETEQNREKIKQNISAIEKNTVKILKNQTNIDLIEVRDENEMLEGVLAQMAIKQQEKLNEIARNKTFEDNKQITMKLGETNAKIKALDELIQSEEFRNALEKRKELIKAQEKAKYEEELATKLYERKKKLEEDKFIREQQLTPEEMKAIQDQKLAEIEKLNSEISTEEKNMNQLKKNLLNLHIYEKFKKKKKSKHIKQNWNVKNGKQNEKKLKYKKL